jgi:type II secretory pathway pseudopilin PulG
LSQQQQQSGAAAAAAVRSSNSGSSSSQEQQQQQQQQSAAVKRRQRGQQQQKEPKEATTHKETIATIKTPKRQKSGWYQCNSQFFFPLLSVSVRVCGDIYPPSLYQGPPPLVIIQSINEWCFL